MSQTAKKLLACQINPFNGDGADFDGSTSYRTGSALTGVIDGKTGVLSVWVRVDGGNGTARRIFCSGTTAAGATTCVQLEMTTTNTISLICRNSSVTNILRMDTVTAFVPTGTWIHILASWDLANTTGTLYINDVLDIDTGNDLFTNDTIDYTQADWAIAGSAASSFRFIGCIADLYFAPNQYLDFSVSSNRRKFISNIGKPVSLGPTGQVPTGTVPAVYFRLNSGDAPSSFTTNKVGVDNFSTGSGTISRASTDPYYNGNVLIADSADFDGTNDYMTKAADLTGNADGKTGIFSTWVRLDGEPNTSMRIFCNGSADDGILVERRGFGGVAKVLSVTSKGTGGSRILDVTTTALFTTSSDWVHLLSSWDLNSAAVHLYINDVSDANVVLSTNANCDYTSTTWGVGAANNGGFKLNGCLAEVYFAPNQYLDFSDANNRRKFITSTLKPANLGPTGTIPTGTAPAVYFHINDGQVATEFNVNNGSGGNFTNVGSLDTGSSSPTD